MQCALAIVALIATPLAAAEPAVVATEFIFEKAPFPSCHASTIVETSDGLVTAWFAGQYERHPSVGIWLSRKVDEKWSEPVEVANGNQPDGTRQPCWNPVLFQPSQGPLLLFFKVGPSPSKWWGELKTSTDSGKTWSAATRLPDGIAGPIKNKPVQLANGDLLSGSSSEDNPAPTTWRAHFELSTDNGATWKKIVPDASGINAIQPSILIRSDGRLQAIGRTKHGKIFETWSSDNGRSWTALSLTELPNPSSGTDAVTLRDGRHLLIYNPTTKGRTPLSVAVSKDGKTWHIALILENEPGEYSYPAVIQTRDGLIHFTYTWKRQRIKHVVADPAKFQQSALLKAN